MKPILASTSNSAKSISKISFNNWHGIINGNIFEETQYPPEPIIASPCDSNLDFSCEDSSHYIGVI